MAGSSGFEAKQERSKRKLFRLEARKSERKIRSKIKQLLFEAIKLWEIILFGSEQKMWCKIKNISVFFILHWNENKLKVHKNENFFGSDFEFCAISLLVMLKY